MRRLRVCLAVHLTLSLVLGLTALCLPAKAEPPTDCPRPAGPPGFECPGCPTVVDPVVCTVICPGGPQQRTFSNQCFASCSGYLIQGECQRTGG